MATLEFRRNGSGNTASWRRFEARASLEACVRGFVVRSVETTTESEHQSHFPATTSCSLSWFLAGSAVRPGEEPVHERIVFRGPQTRPVVARHRGPLRMFILLLAPDALCDVTGIGVDRYLNRICPLAAALDESWKAMALNVFHAHSDEDRVTLLETFLEPRWRSARSSNRVSWGPAQRQGDWSRAAIARMHDLTKGQSKRQFERRTRTITGWSARGLKNIARAEGALLMAARATQPRVNWASIAAEAGYADQSHLCREVRRYTGLSPHHLWLHLQNDQALWVYKAWFGGSSV